LQWKLKRHSKEAEAIIAAIHHEWEEWQGSYEEFRFVTGPRQSGQIRSGYRAMAGSCGDGAAGRSLTRCRSWFGATDSTRLLRFGRIECHAKQFAHAIRMAGRGDYCAPADRVCSCNFDRTKETAVGQRETERLNEIISGAGLASAVCTTAELGVADHIQRGSPRSARQLAEATGCLEGPLYRLMRLLASYGLFSETRNGEFDHTVLDNCHIEGISTTKSHWAWPIYVPTFYAYAVWPGITVTSMGRNTDDQVRVYLGGVVSTNLFLAGYMADGNVFATGFSGVGG